MEKAISITVSDLTTALQRWDEQAREENWPDRTDARRFRDNAEYLFGLLDEAN